MKSDPSPGEFRFEPVRPPTLKERVAAQIRTAILRGDLAPGARIVESLLAKQMNVAQTTVREAIGELENQGLVVKFVNRETLVRRLLPADLKKLYRARITLEGLAVELAHAHATESGLRPLYSIIEDMRRAARKKDFPEFYQFDLRFHHALWDLANNEFLQRALSTLSVGPFAFVLAGSRAPLDVDYVRVAEDHRDILEAMKNSTAEAARKVMEEKLANWHRMQLRMHKDHRARRPAPGEKLLWRGRVLRRARL